MTLTENETTFLLWSAGAMLSVIAVGCTMIAKSMFGIAKDINEIKQTVVRLETRHDGLEKRVELLEKK